LHRYYGLDLLDHYRPGGKLSLRKLGVLISYLPSESATATAIRNATADSVGQADADPPDPGKGQWALNDMLLAAVIDELRWSRYEFRKANSDQPGQEPSQVERPGVKVKRRTRLNREQQMMLDPRMRGEWHE
jgi:hypothetical protein